MNDYPPARDQRQQSLGAGATQMHPRSKLRWGPAEAIQLAIHRPGVKLSVNCRLAGCVDWAAAFVTGTWAVLWKASLTLETPAQAHEGGGDGAQCGLIVA